MMIGRLIAAVLFVGLLALPANDLPAQVQDGAQVQQERQAEGQLAMLYTMVADPDQVDEFEQALAEHARWRLEQGDPRNWDVYQVVAGDPLGRYYVRAPNLSWEEMESYDADFGPRAAQHFTNTVGPYLSSLSNMVTRAHEDALNVPTDMNDLTEMDLLAVTIFEIEPGEMEQFQEAMTEFHRGSGQAQGTSYYGFHSAIVGEERPQVQFVTLHDGWADLQGDDPMMAQQQQLRDEGDRERVRGGLDAHEDFMSRFHAVDNMILRYRTDLSVRR